MRNELENAITHMINNNANKFKESVESILSQKINDRIENHKTVIAQTILTPDDE